jgi:hypothetical protein
MRFPIGSTLRISAFVALGCLLAAGANAQSYGTNLIVNPGGDFIDAAGTVQESTSSYPTLTDTATMFGWTVTDPGTNSAPTTYRYDSTPGDEDYPLSSEGPEDAGGNFIGSENFFFGGFNADGTGNSTASQVIDVSALSADIDGTGVLYSLSGWIAGYFDSTDAVSITATFRDAGNASLGSASIGPLSPADRSNTRDFFFRSTDGTDLLPTGTTSIEVAMNFTGANSSLDGYADNLSLTLAPVPAPGALLTALLGAAPGLLLLRRRRVR